MEPKRADRHIEGSQSLLSIGLFFAILCLNSLAASAQGVDAKVSLTRNSIYIGESVDLKVTVKGQKTPQIDVSGIKDFAVHHLGTSTHSGFGISFFFNGRRTGGGDGGVTRTHTYRLTPRQTGTLKAGPIVVKVDGQTKTLKGPAVTVQKLDSQGFVIMRVKASKESVLVDESFDVTLSIAIKRLPPPFHDIDPIHANSSPSLQVGYLEQRLPEGLTGPRLDQLLSPYLRGADEAGFELNNFTTRSNDPFGFPSFFESSKARFLFPRESVTINGEKYFRYSVTATFKATQEGSQTFGPAIFRGHILESADPATGRANGKRIFAVGPAATVHVVPPPEEGRPESFVGALSTNLVAEAKLDTQTCRVGDPLSLTLSISGAFRMDAIYPPQLSRQAALTENFRVYEDNISTERKDGVAEFTYMIRPTQAGTYELPPLEVAYYDPDTRSYAKTYTRAIPIRAEAAEELNRDDIFGTPTNNIAETAGNLRKGSTISAPITMNPNGALPARLAGTHLHLILAVVGPLVFGLVLVGRGTAAVTRRVVELRRQKNGLYQARRLLADTLENRDLSAREVAHAVCTALRQYLAYRFGADEPSLTPDRARRLLDEKSVDPGLSERLAALLERNFNASFAQTNADRESVEADCREAMALIESLEAGGAK